MSSARGSGFPGKSAESGPVGLTSISGHTRGLAVYRSGPPGRVVSPAGRLRAGGADPAVGCAAPAPGGEGGTAAAGGDRRWGGMDPRLVRGPGGAGEGHGVVLVPPAQAVLPEDQ